MRNAYWRYIENMNFDIEINEPDLVANAFCWNMLMDSLLDIGFENVPQFI
jgi:hypothetical protein